MRLLRVALAVALIVVPPVVNAACWVSVAGPSFGAYDPLAPAPVDAAGTIQYWCTTAARVSVSAGSSGSYASRRMQGGQGTMAYNLYVDAARTQIWGDGTGGSAWPTVAAGLFQSLPIYGRIPARQNVGAGSYSDSLVVTFTF